MESQRKRYAWVDYLKAFLIFTIVTEHMAYFVFNNTPNCYIKWIISFNLCAFFFLSGMFAPHSNSLPKLLKSVAALLIPFLVLGSIWTLYFSKLPQETLFTTPMHNGYWFIWSLMVLRLLFYLRNAIINRLPNHCFSTPITDLLIVASVVALCSLSEKIFSPNVCSILSLNMPRTCVIYYFAGHWYHELVLRKGHNIPKTITECALLLFILSFVVQEFYSSVYLHYASNLIRGVCGTIFVVQLFKSLPEQFPGSQWLQFMGKHTLEIYVGHYFFIPIGISACCMPIIAMGDGIAVLLYSLIATMICLIMCGLLCVLDKFTILNTILFGKFKA